MRFKLFISLHSNFKIPIIAHTIQLWAGIFVCLVPCKTAPTIRARFSWTINLNEGNWRNTSQVHCVTIELVRAECGCAAIGYLFFLSFSLSFSPKKCLSQWFHSNINWKLNIASYISNSVGRAFSGSWNQKPKFW